MTAETLRPAGSFDPAGRMPPERWRRAGRTLAILLILASLAFTVRTLGSRRDAFPVSDRVSQSSTTPLEVINERLRVVPDDAKAWAALGSAYVEEARVNGDPRLYPKAEDALHRSLALKAEANVSALTGLGALAAARHDFSTALAWAEKARAINPYNAAIYGVIADTQVELGRYDEAFTTIQRMLDLRPGLTSYSRASYAWELQGNIPNAKRAFELALQAAGRPADAAFATFYLGELAWHEGKLDEAEDWYEQSLRHDPTYLAAVQGLAAVYAARGDLQRAIRASERVVATSQSLHDVIELGDLYLAAGNAAASRALATRVADLVRLFRANGVDVDLEIAAYNADHRVDLAEGLAAARREWSRRQSIHVADALAWALYANGRYREALPYAQKALRLGTRSASFHFHKGMIERALGMRDAARVDLRRAMAINPHFSFVWTPRVPRILAELG